MAKIVVLAIGILVFSGCFSGPKQEGAKMSVERSNIVTFDHYIKYIAAGANHTCVVLQNSKTTDQVKCWGNNDYGQLGTSGQFMYLGAALVPFHKDVFIQGISAGSVYTCFISYGKVYCWGSNAFGQLGNDEIENLSAVPVVVKGVENIVSISAGSSHACAIVRDVLSPEGILIIKCWGENHHGQLGASDRAFSRNLYTTAVTVPGITNPRMVAAGGDHTCALSDDRSVLCWGSNENGQLGIGTKGSNQSPTIVPTLSNVRNIVVGYQSTCVIGHNGVVWCWGDTYTPAGDIIQAGIPSKLGAS